MSNRFTVDADWYTRANDTGSVMSVVLKDGAGDVVDVSGATIEFRAYGPGDDVTAVVTLDTPASGEVSTIPVFTEAGTYYGRFHVTFGGGTTQTFPTADDIVIEVRSPE